MPNTYLRIDRLIAYTPENFAFAEIAVGIEEVDDIIQDGQVFKAYDENDNLLIEVKDFYRINVTYVKESE